MLQYGLSLLNAKNFVIQLISIFVYIYDIQDLNSISLIITIKLSKK